MEIVAVIAASMGVAWASGINLYAALFMLGWMGSSGSIELPPDLQVLQHPGVMAAAGLMYCIEFFADKIPGVDNGWALIHSFIRIPAGALLAAGAIASVAPQAEIIGLILGGTLAAGAHFTKAGSRVLVNTSPEPFSNWAVSVGEDLLVIAGLWTALHHPVLFLILLAAFIALVVWLVPKVWRGVRQMFVRLSRWLGAKPQAPEAPPRRLDKPGEPI